MDIITRLNEVKHNLVRAEQEAERPEGSVTLVAVSKTFDADAIRPVLEAGHRVFGENRVQESQGKWPGLKQAYDGVELHLIGPLQSNTVEDAVALFDVIETVDREKIARALAEEMKRQNRFLPVYIQINTGLEPQKAGIAPDDAVSFAGFCKNELGLNVTGLMCIPPADENPGPHFALLARLAAKAGLSRLSMGMSGDYGVAIGFGATSVRVGSAIFGSR